MGVGRSEDFIGTHEGENVCDLASISVMQPTCRPARLQRQAALGWSHIY